MTRITAIFLACIVSVIAVEKIFDNITILVFKNNKPVRLLNADTLENEINVTEVWIENENIPKLRNQSFKGLTKLEQVRIQHSGIVKVEKETFKGLPRLKIVNLSFNKIKKIDKDVFRELPINKLFLIGNGIEYLSEIAFCDLPLLEVLDLSNNNLMYLNYPVFYNTSSLRIINMSYNKIMYIPKNFFREALENVIAYQESTLDLGNNKISTLDSKTFSGIHNIKNLLLNSNILTYLPNNIFDDIRYVENINLENNYIEQLDNILMSSEAFKTAEEIVLSANPLTCSFTRRLHKWTDFNKKNILYDVDCINKTNSN